MSKQIVDKKPSDNEEYRQWLNSKLNVSITTATKTRYESVMSKVKNDLCDSPFWSNFRDVLRKASEKYLAGTGYQLLQTNDPVEISIKPFDSLVDKSFRRNVIENKNWPDPPDGNWVVPENWLSRMNDLIRCCVVVKYMDGVECLITEINQMCALHSISCQSAYEARIEGYYAAHMYVKQNFEIPRVNWDTEKMPFKFEIQITTQLQEVIRKMTHTYYEKRRSRVKPEDRKWQWDWRSDEFTPYYLGHILHYVEGMILEVRDKQKDVLS